MNARRQAKGFTLIEAMVFVAISSIVTLGLTSAFISFVRQSRAASEKLDINEAKNLFRIALLNELVCTWQLAGRQVVTGGVTSSVPSPTQIDLDVLYQGMSTTSAILADAGELLMTSPWIRVQRVSFENILATGNPNEYVGEFVISFQNDTMVMAREPIRLLQIFTVSGAPPNQSIANCVGLNSRGRVSKILTFDSSGVWVVPAGVDQAEVELWGGGAGGAAGGDVKAGNRYRGGGGGGGGYIRARVAVVPGSSIPITIGSGGAAGTKCREDSQPGGATSFGSYLVAPGGGKADGDANPTDPAGGGGGSPLSSSFVNVDSFEIIQGGPGESGKVCADGRGGLSPRGGARVPGGGGHGGSCSEPCGQNGEPGAGGRVVVRY